MQQRPPSCPDHVEQAVVEKSGPAPVEQVVVEDGDALDGIRY